MRIYLACTVRGDRGAIEGLRTLADGLASAGHTVLTTHLLDAGVDGAESALSERDVYERDIAWLESCDVLIAEASGSSFGVGFEVGYVLGRSVHCDQRVLLAYRSDRRDVISRLIAGNAHPRCEVIAYRTPAELAAAVAARLDDQGPMSASTL